MHSDVEVLWKELRDQMTEWWGKLTDDDLDVIGGNRDQLVGKLQDRTAGPSVTQPGGCE